MATRLPFVGTQLQINQASNTDPTKGITSDQGLADIVALSDGRFIVVFYSNNDTNYDIHAQFVNANGTLSGTNSFNLTNVTGLQYEPAVAARAAGAFTTVWTDYGLAGVIPDPDIYHAVTDSTGTITTARSLLMNDAASALLVPDVATMQDGRQIVVASRAFSGTQIDIVFDVLNPDGTQLFAAGAFGFLDPTNTRVQYAPAAAGGPGQALVVYYDNTGEANAGDFHISARLFDGATNSFATPIKIVADVGAGHVQYDPDVAYIGGGRYAIVYNQDAENIFARIYDPVTGLVFPEIAVNGSATETYAPNVAATADGGFVVTWYEVGGPAPDTDYSIHERRFDPYGNAYGEDFLVNTARDNLQYFPVVAVGGSNVFTAWTDFGSRPGDTSPSSIQGQAATAPVFDFNSAHYGDFDNSGRDDILFQNTANGAVQLWTTNTTGMQSSTVSLGTLPAGFHIDGTGNFNSTPGEDILLRSGSNQIGIWVMNGATVSSFQLIGSTSSQYLNSGMGDFTGDGQTDLLFRNSHTGEIASWQVSNNALGPAAPKVLGSAPSFYQVVAVADFTGDQQSDILFRNLNTGEIAEWQITNNQLGPAAPHVVGSTSTSYHVVGTGDFDGNGANDILFRHDISGQLAVWLLNSAGDLLGAPATVGGPVAANFHVDGIGDRNGDGRSDIVFRDQDGNLAEWLMNGSTIATVQSVGTQSQNFSTAAHHFDIIP